jgi:hypothetical protein
MLRDIAEQHSTLRANAGAAKAERGINQVNRLEHGMRHYKTTNYETTGLLTTDNGLQDNRPVLNAAMLK